MIGPLHRTAVAFEDPFARAVVRCHLASVQRDRSESHILSVGDVEQVVCAAAAWSWATARGRGGRSSWFTTADALRHGTYVILLVSRQQRRLSPFNLSLIRPHFRRHTAERYLERARKIAIGSQRAVIFDMRGVLEALVRAPGVSEVVRDSAVAVLAGDTPAMPWPVDPPVRLGAQAAPV